MKIKQWHWALIWMVVAFVIYCISVAVRGRDNDKEELAEHEYPFAHSDSIFTIVDGVRKQVKLPHFTTEEMKAIQNPKEGDLLFNDDLGVQCFYNGKGWEQLTGKMKPIKEK